MKKITIEVADGYDHVITFTLIGRSHNTTNVVIFADEVSNGAKFTVDENGKITKSKEGEE